MKQVIIAGALAFTVFAAAGTGVGVMKAKAAVAVADSLLRETQLKDSLHADSVAKAQAAAETPHEVIGDEPTADSTHGVATAVAEGVAHAANAASHAASTATSAVATAASALPTLSPMPSDLVRLPVADSAALAERGRLAKLFLAMSARDAAKVLEQMTDHDVVAILRALPERRAGEIMATITPTRSATLARAMLNRVPGGE